MKKQHIGKFIYNNYDICITNAISLEEGITNSFILESDSQKYILKFVPDSFRQTVLSSLNVLTFLEKKKFNCPRIVKNKSETLYSLNGKEEVAVLYEYIESKKTTTNMDYGKLGSLVGELHLQMLNYNDHLKYQQKDFFIDRYIRILEQKKYSKAKTSEYKKLGNFLWRQIKVLPKGYCHGDLHVGNILVGADNNYNILDFDTSCTAFPIYDVMVICNATDYFDFEFTTMKATDKNLKNFIAEYSKYRFVSENELKNFYYLIGVYHFQLQATIVEIFGLNCIDDDFIDKQLNWLKQWMRASEELFGLEFCDL